VADRAGRALPGPLVAGFAISAIGGPLALTALLVPDAAGPGGISSLGLVTLAGVALFAAPMLVWWRFSGEIASSGGLYTFVERAAGRRVALAHGAAWILSYFLYLPFTVTELVYDQIPESFPGIRPHQTAIEIAAPFVIVGAVILAERAVMGLMLVGAVVQIGSCSRWAPSSCSTPVRMRARLRPTGRPARWRAARPTFRCSSCARASRSTSEPRCAAAAACCGERC
jgi:hypothetical protein